MTKIGMQEAAITFSITIKDLCGISYPFNLLTLKLSLDETTEIDLYKIEVTNLNVLTIDTYSLSPGYGRSSSAAGTDLTQNSSLEIYFGFNFKPNANGFTYTRMIIGTEGSSITSSSLPKNYTGLKFDETARFLFCADAQGMAVASCSVEFYGIEDRYTTYNPIIRTSYELLGSVNPVLIASYTLDQKSGKTIKNNVNNQLGDAKLGTAATMIPNGKAPKWNKDDIGVEFTDSDQYILIPNFIPKRTTPITSSIFTINFWLKIEDIENNTGFIFRYARADNISQSLFSLTLNKMSNFHYFIMQIANSEHPSSSVSYSVWNMVTVSFTCFEFSSLCTAFSYLNQTVIMKSNFLVRHDERLPFKSSDLVLLGGPNGFKGKIFNLRIFNPGSQRLIQPTCPSAYGCELAIGAFDATNKNCLKCSGSDASWMSNCITCPKGSYVSGFECIDIEEEITFSGEAASKGTAAAAKTMTQAVSAVSSGSSVGVSAAISGKVFSNIKYINIAYSEELEVALGTWTSNYFTLGFETKMPTKFERRFVNGTVPYVFAKHDVNSCFLINFWEPLIMLLILILFFLIILVLDWIISQKKKDLGYRVLTRAKVTIMNFLIAQLYGMYGDVAFYAMIEFKTTNVASGINFLSEIVIVLLLAAMMLGFFLHINLLKRYQNVRVHFGTGDMENRQHFDKFIADHEGIQVIFDDFKDHSIIHQSFLLVLNVRDILFSIILATLFEHPLTECILILFMNIIMLLYLLVKRPFKDIFAQIQQVILEVITLVVNVSIFILAVLDRKNLEAHDRRETIGKLLIVVNMIFNFVIVFFMLFNLIRQGYGVYKDYKQRRKIKDIRPRSPRNILNFQNVTLRGTNLFKNSQEDGRNSHRSNNTEASPTIIKTGFEGNTSLVNSHYKPNSQSQNSMEVSFAVDSFRNFTHHADFSKVEILRKPANESLSERRKRKWKKKRQPNENQGH